MGFFSDLFFGPSEPENTGKKKTTGGWSSYSPYGNEYDDYYGSLYDDAMSGDAAAIAEMRDEFGDDWEGEY